MGDAVQADAVKAGFKCSTEIEAQTKAVHAGVVAILIMALMFGGFTAVMIHLYGGFNEPEKQCPDCRAPEPDPNAKPDPCADLNECQVCKDGRPTTLNSFKCQFNPLAIVLTVMLFFLIFFLIAWFKSVNLLNKAKALLDKMGDLMGDIIIGNTYKF